MASGGPVDVFGTIDELGIPLVFTPLDKLLGACVRTSPGVVGLMVTSERDLHLQRFTAAHELGHFLLEHEGILDREVQLPGQTKGRPVVEVEADAFAAEFLMPKWLFRDVARRQGWGRKNLEGAGIVYQLSLRLAVSYAATCWGLVSQGFISQDAAAKLDAVRPKDCKRQLLGDLELDDPWADVWAINQGDHRSDLTLGPTDVIVLSLQEQAGAGYLWNRDGLESAGFKVVVDDHLSPPGEAVGASVLRRLVAQVPSRGQYKVHLTERRPWARTAPPLHEFDLHCSTFGKQKQGEFVRGAPTASEARH